MIAYVDNDLLYRILQTIHYLLKFAITSFHNSALLHLPILHEKIEYLAIHPMKEIANEAQAVEKVLLALLRKSGSDIDFDEYNS
jgi:hypothetical protein